MTLPKPSDRYRRRPNRLAQHDLQRTIAAGVTIADIARIAGLHPVTVSEVNRGARDTISVYTVGRLLTALEKIDNGEVDVARRTPKATPVQGKGADVCQRGHDRAVHTMPKPGGGRYCKKCRKINRLDRERAS